MVGRRARRLGPGVVAWTLIPVLGLPPLVATAQDRAPQTQMSQAGERDFDIAAQGLGEAMILFARQSGFQVSVATNVARNARTAAVRGRYTPSAALAQMLVGTGLVYRVSGTMIAVEAAPQSGSSVLQLDPVQVQGVSPVPSQALIDNIPPPYAGGQVATGGQLGLLGNRGVMDTPFNQTSYTAQKAQDQQAKTVKDVLADDPSVRSIRSDGVPGTDGVRIRGFPVETTAWAYGGLYGMLPGFSVMAEMAERVEVLRGPAAMLAGMQPGGAIGGVVNVVPKRAPSQPLNQVTANYVSGAQFGGHADIARRFGPDQEFGVRVNGVYKAGQTDIKWNTDERALGSLGLDFRGQRVRLSADLGYQTRAEGGAMGYMGLAAGVQVPYAPNVRSNPFGQPWGWFYNQDLFGVVRGEIDLAERVTAYVSIGAHDARFSGVYPSITTVGNFIGTASATAVANKQYLSTWTAEGGLRAGATTGPIDHELALTATTFTQSSGSSFASSAAVATNIYNPTVIARPNLPLAAPTKASVQELTSFAVADTLTAVNKRLQLTIGGRLQQVEAENFNAVSGAQTSNYSQAAFSPSVALVVKPFWENVSFYGNYIQGLQQGTIVTATFTNAGEVFPPYRSTQYEAGVKVDWGKLTTTASVFQISQPFTFSNLATNTLVLGGEQVNQGLEFNFFGEITDGFRVLGGAMFLNPVLAKTQGGVTDGWIAPFSPGVQFNLMGEWDLPFMPGLTAMGRGVYTGAQYVDATYPRRMLSEWTRFDVGLRYAFDNPAARGKLLVARFNVENVFDLNYYASGNNVSTITLGAPRTFRISLTADF